MRKKSLPFVVIVALLLAVLLAACSSSGGDEGSGEMITLIANPWPSSELNVNVAKIIIEKELGNPVEIVALDENAQWDALAAGNADASLEVWPSGHGERIVQYIEQQKVVENGGALGPVGEIGWFVPTYVVNQNPQLATWEGYKDPALAGLFATAETGSLGQFTAGDPSWVQYDADIIKNLGLNLQVVTAGSEDSLLATVSSAYARQQPVLFYFYSPHAIFSRFDLTQVALPAYSDDCYAGAESGGVACAYPEDQLFKIFSTKLSEKAPDVYTLLKNMNYGSEAQIEMLAMLDEGKTVEEAAQAWVDAHESEWKGWLP
ncbi:MAG TPA: glycine betaine ABC transporter substrate-binding protein [Chloroflexota bacterium]|nr:glycine betaine ABC transporter substrate-binding protein [Chloroflexota bacterium]HUM68420.1 glycine betaine ABC transporter substrate-binding protein [Chloroflexota bacterium]